MPWTAIKVSIFLLINANECDACGKKELPDPQRIEAGNIVGPEGSDLAAALKKKTGEDLDVFTATNTSPPAGWLSAYFDENGVSRSFRICGPCAARLGFLAIRPRP